MADGVLGPRKAAAVQLVEGENRGAHGLAAIRNPRVVETNVLGHQPNSPTAMPFVVVMGVYFNIFIILLLLVVNGGWSTWSDFGTCSEACGGGTKTKHR